MTDNSPWQAPGGSQPEPVPPLAPPTAAPVPPAAPFVPPIVPPAPVAPPAPFGAPGSAGYAYAATPVPGAAPGWTPPPKPGLIPLRPLTLGTMLGASFQVLRRNPRPMFGFSLLLTGGAYVLAFLVVGIFAFWGISRVTSATGEDADAIAAGGVAATLLGSLIPIAGSIAVLAILQGIVVLEVARGTLGEKLPLRGLLRAARGRIWALIGWSLLATAIVAVVLTIVVLLIVLIATLGGDAGIGVAVLVGILAGLGGAVLGAWLWTKLCLVPTVIVIERLSIRNAVARSWSLTKGYFWKTLGIQLLVGVIISTVSNIVSFPLSFVMGLAGGLLNSQGDVGVGLTIAIVTTLLTVVVSVVVGAVSAVVQSATTALIYIDIRMRKEGLDLELARFVEARQAGIASVPDPYLLRQSVPTA